MKDILMKMIRALRQTPTGGLTAVVLVAFASDVLQGADVVVQWMT
ncbi:hypothetical protein ACW14Y_42485 [Kitasatospora sp. cg17-2]